MCACDVPEQVIQEITDHRSLEVCGYKRTCQKQHRNASKAISGICTEVSKW